MQIKSLTEHENILLARNLFVGFIIFFFYKYYIGIQMTVKVLEIIIIIQIKKKNLKSQH